MALWGGRFSQQSSQLFTLFNDSLPVDYRLVEQDIIGSIAWSQAIASVGIITLDESNQLQQALTQLLNEVQQQPELILASGAEDIHSFVEQALITKVGDLGKNYILGVHVMIKWRQI